MTESTDKKQKKRPAHLFKPGVSGNPNGRPKGSISAIGKVKKMFTEHPEKFEEFIIEYVNDPSNRKHVVEMLDGKPRQNIGLDGGSEGLAISFAPVFNKLVEADVVEAEILDNTIKDNSND